MKKPFDKKKYYWKKGINYRENWTLYRVGKGEQGVLLCSPYKEEILPFWKFKTPEIAHKSSEKIEKLFYQYLKKDDFPGADMARKFLQMGFTRARRYTNYKGGRKYDSSGKPLLKGTGDPEKAVSASIFYKKWKKVEKDPVYKKLKEAWKKELG